MSVYSINHQSIFKSIIMKSSITFLALALVAFTNVTLASNSELKANNYLTSFENIQDKSELTLSKFKRVSSEEAGSLSSEIENLKHKRTIDEIIAEDIKVIESNVSVVETDCPDIESLKHQKTIDEIIADNLQVIESKS